MSARRGGGGRPGGGGFPGGWGGFPGDVSPPVPPPGGPTVLGDWDWSDGTLGDWSASATPPGIAEVANAASLGDSAFGVFCRTTGSAGPAFVERDLLDAIPAGGVWSVRQHLEVPFAPALSGFTWAVASILTPDGVAGLTELQYGDDGVWRAFISSTDGQWGDTIALSDQPTSGEGSVAHWLEFVQDRTASPRPTGTWYLDGAPVAQYVDDVEAGPPDPAYLPGVVRLGALSGIIEVHVREVYLGRVTVATGYQGIP